MDIPKPHPKALRLVYFWIGILATFLYRIIVVLNNVGAVWVQIAWYVGTVGFLIYFIHRYEISEKRAKLIAAYDLERKVGSLDGLSPAERQAMAYLFGTLQSSKEKWNYIFIFIMSGLALIAGVIIDFIIKV